MKKILLSAIAALSLATTTMAQTVPNYVPTNGLVSWWPFDGNANDLIGTNNLNSNGAVSYTADRFGNLNKAALFNGSNEYFNKISPVLPSGNSSRTLSIWFNGTGFVSNIVGQQCPFMYGDLVNGGCYKRFGFVTTAGLNQVQFIGKCNPRLDNISSHQNVWHNLVYTFNGTNQTLALYQDGLLIMSSILAGTENTVLGELRIGSGLDDQNPVGNIAQFDGVIDDIGIWNRVLTQQEITSLYQSQTCNLSATTTQVNVLCNGASTGSATTTASGGTAPYTYSWAPTGGSAATASGLAAGTYTCTITDVNQCTTTNTVTITQPIALATTSTQTNILCNGGTTGSASVSVTGGTPVYTYSWAPSGGTSATASNLSAGNYTCTVRDANQCTTTKAITITQPTALVTTSTQTNVTCFGLSNGSANITATGGTPTYTYSWSPTGGTTASAGNLSAGNYTCTISDANQCISTKTVTISQPNALTVNITPLVNTIPSGNNGTFNASSLNGSANFQWQSKQASLGWINVPSNLTYSGVNSNQLTITNAQLNNHLQDFRVIASFGNCSDTSNIGSIRIADTCINTVQQTIYDTTFVTVTDTNYINQTIYDTTYVTVTDTNYVNQTIYDTTYVTVTDTNYVTVYDTVTTYISVTDTLFINVNTVGLNNNTIINTIKVFPNPTNSYLNLDYGNYSNLNGYSVKIVNTLSQVIYNQPITQQSETIDLSTFGGNGIYYLNILNPQGNIVEVRKIVLQ